MAISEKTLALLEKATAPADPLERLRPSEKARWQDPYGYRAGAVADLRDVRDELDDVAAALDDIVSEMAETEGTAEEGDEERLAAAIRGAMERLGRLSKDIASQTGTLTGVADTIEEVLA